MSNCVSDAYENIGNEVLACMMQIQGLDSDFMHLRIDDDSVPLEYVREKLAGCYAHHFCNYQSSTHILRASTNNETFEMPVHDIVLISQCIFLQYTVRLESDQEREEKPIWVLEKVPHRQTLFVLLKWLYSNDEGELRDALMKFDKRTLFGFAQNCIFLGVINAKVSEVMRSVLGIETQSSVNINHDM